MVVFAMASCGKDEEPTPTANLEGKWNLATSQVVIQPIAGDKSDETMDFKNQGVFIELKSNNKFSGNIVLADEAADIIMVGDEYESDYEINGNVLTLKIYDEAYEEYIPVKLNVESVTESQMVLKITKSRSDGSDESL
ncbi:MAG: lipocalin family protein [Leadbetterella sp.]|nr:lipocalin family protein [Leadbetterella sp.]